MWRRLFNAWCVACLILTAALLAGYVLDMRFGAAHGSTARNELREVELLAGRGRLRCFLSGASTAVVPATTGFHASGRADWTRLRQMRFDVTGFDLHWIARPGSPGGMSMFLISCPLWFAMIVALVSPAIWLIARRRRRRREREPAQGFGVVHAGSTESR